MINRLNYMYTGIFIFLNFFLVLLFDVDGFSNLSEENFVTGCKAATRSILDLRPINACTCECMSIETEGRYHPKSKRWILRASDSDSDISLRFRFRYFFQIQIWTPATSKSHVSSIKYQDENNNR